MDTGIRNYLTITGGYWAFTLTDGAIRMLVVLYFHQIGYSPFEVAMLFLFYEFFGIVTNLLGGWLASRLGLNVTMHAGMLLQVVALAMLAVPDAWLTVIYVMFAQAFSGIAKDLNKMSAKASVKTLVTHDANARLFKWVAALTGSKNALKGFGFFLGSILLQLVGFRGAVLYLASGLLLVLAVTYFLLPRELGTAKVKARFTQLFSNSKAVNWLSAARFFLFGARDVWFVVALPVFLTEILGWSYVRVGGFLALWVIAYGLVQASTPMLLRLKGKAPRGTSAMNWAIVLMFVPAGIALALPQSAHAEAIIILGLLVFGLVFAINSAVHSYLILAFASHDHVALNVGFYYMANAGGRLLGTVLSGWGYQQFGLDGCLWISSGFIATAAILSARLPSGDQDNR